MTEPTAYSGPAIIELMGHRRTAGIVTEVTQYGSAQLRVDTPNPDGFTVATQFYGGSAIYCLTPCDEDAMRAALESRWSLPGPVRMALMPPEPDPDFAEVDEFLAPQSDQEPKKDDDDEVIF
jgi:hypothetical protein